MPNRNSAVPDHAAATASAAVPDHAVATDNAAVPDNNELSKLGLDLTAPKLQG